MIRKTSIFFTTIFLLLWHHSNSQTAQFIDTTDFYRITSPFYEMNLTTFLDLNLKEYSKIYYQSQSDSKGKITKMAFVSGFVWKTNKAKNLIIEYTLKNAEHLTNVYKTDRPAFSDTTYYIQDLFGKLHPLEDTLNLATKIDSVNQIEKQATVQTFDENGRLIKSKTNWGATNYEYDKENNITRKFHTTKMSNDTTEKIVSQTRYEYLNDRISKIKYYYIPTISYLTDGLYKTEDYKYSIYGLGQKQYEILISTKTFEEITEKMKLKKHYTKYFGINETKTTIQWNERTGIGRSTTDFFNEPKVNTMTEVFIK
jgi:YD repeat-containing protein